MSVFDCERIHPVGNRMLVRLDPEEESVQVGALVIPNERRNRISRTGIVVRLGVGFDQGVFPFMEGQRVLLAENSGHHMTHVDGSDWTVSYAENVIALMPSDKFAAGATPRG